MRGKEGKMFLFDEILIQRRRLKDETSAATFKGSFHPLLFSHATNASSSFSSSFLT